MEIWLLPLVFGILLFGVFVFRKLWLGALIAILFFVFVHLIANSDLSFIHLPLISGSVISVELALLLFGAYLFYSTLTDHLHFKEFIQITSTFSSKLFILIILCVFMGSFMEGIAGFGIPAMLVAPLLLTLGFKPLTCIVLPLATNTTAVTFGALGTPLKVGFGIFNPEPTVDYTLILNFLPGLSLPFLLAFLYSKTEQVNVDWRKNWKMLLGAGICFAVPYLVMGKFSVEFPSVFAGLVGLILFVITFVPKKEKPSALFWFKTFYPYFLFILFLLIAKLLLSGYDWKFGVGTRPLSYFQPGIVFIGSSLIYLILIRKKNPLSLLLIQSRSTLIKTGKSISTIFLLVILVQLLQPDLSNLVNTYYVSLEPATKIYFNPILGIFGSFVSGSATMSNLLLGSAIMEDVLLGESLPLLLALLHTGSAIGNSISLQNIIMVKSVVNQDRVGFPVVLKYNAIAVGLYLMLVLLASLGFSTGKFLFI
jgi:lactate permease